MTEESAGFIFTTSLCPLFSPALFNNISVIYYSSLLTHVRGGSTSIGFTFCTFWYIVLVTVVTSDRFSCPFYLLFLFLFHFFFRHFTPPVFQAISSINAILLYFLFEYLLLLQVSLSDNSFPFSELWQILSPSQSKSAVLCRINYTVFSLLSL